MKRPLALVTGVFAILTAAACGGGTRGLVPIGTAYNVESLASHGTSSTASVKITIAAPKAALRSQLRSRYFSRSSNGVLVQVYPKGKDTKSHLIGQFAIDISSGSKACGGSKGFPRTCVAAFSVPPSAGDDFLISDYNVKPKNGGFAKSAKLLAYGKLANKKISGKKINAYTAYLGGVVAGLSGNAGFVPLPGDGQPHTVALVIDPTDFGNNPISAGKKDPFANPIVVSVTEAGGSGHALLSLNGGAGSTKVKLTQSTDTVAVEYDGGGSAGYGATVTLAAAKVNKAGGARESIAISPLFVSASFGSASLVSAGKLTLSPGLAPTVTFSELNAPSTQTYTASLQGTCFEVATLGVTTATTAIVVTGPVFSAGGCTFKVVDSASTTVELTIANQATTTHVSAPSTVAVEEFPLPHASYTPIPLGIAAGSDGAMWWGESSSEQIGRIPMNATPGSSAQISEYPIPGGSYPVDITSGNDGALWFSDCGAGTIDRIPTNATPGSGAQITHYSAPPGLPYGLAFAPNGTIWYGDTGGNHVANMTTAGNVPITKTTTSRYIEGFTIGPDGNAWFTECGSPPQIGKVTPTGTLTEAAIPLSAAPSPATSPAPFFITTGSDGNIWYVDYDNKAVGKATLSSGIATAFAEFQAPSSGSANLIHVVPGPDGALWFTDCGNGAIGRIPTNATSASDIKEYPLPATGSSPFGIAEGADGALWVTEIGHGGKIARISIAPSAAGTRVSPAVRFTGARRTHPLWLHRRRSPSM